MPSPATNNANVPSLVPASAETSVRENEPADTDACAPGYAKPSFMLMVSAPPSVFKPKTGLEPGNNCIDAMAFFGIRSQLTTSAKASLMRTPSWNTDSPCGVPSERRRGEAAEAHVGLERIAGGRVERDAVRVEVQELGHTAGALALDVAAIRTSARSTAPATAACQDSRQRRRADDLDSPQVDRLVGGRRDGVEGDDECGKRSASRAERKSHRIATPQGSSPTGISAIFL